MSALELQRERQRIRRLIVVGMWRDAAYRERARRFAEACAGGVQYSQFSISLRRHEGYGGRAVSAPLFGAAVRGNKSRAKALVTGRRS